MINAWFTSLGIERKCVHNLPAEQRKRSGRDRIVVSTSRCGRDNPGSNPGHGINRSQAYIFIIIFFFNLVLFFSLYLACTCLKIGFEIGEQWALYRRQLAKGYTIYTIPLYSQGMNMITAHRL